jgi:hypothetical protein
MEVWGEIKSVSMEFIFYPFDDIFLLFQNISVILWNETGIAWICPLQQRSSTDVLYVCVMPATHAQTI